MKLRNAAGTRVGVPDSLVAKYLARGWVPVGGAEVPPPAPARPPTQGAKADPPPPTGDAPTGVVTLNAAQAGEVPDGTAKDVVDWVGDDPARAKQALDAENARGEEARSTLIAKLSKIAD